MGIKRKGHIYILKGSLNDAAAKKIASEILTDSVSEDFSIRRLSAEKIEIIIFSKGNEINCAKSAKIITLIVFFKKEVLDVVGNRIIETLKFMGIEGVKNAACGKIYKVEVPLSFSAAQFSADERKDYYNPVIEKIKCQL